MAQDAYRWSFRSSFRPTPIRMHLRSTPARRARERAELERAEAAAKTAAALMATGSAEVSGSRSSVVSPPQGDSSIQESVLPQGSQTVVPEDAVTVSVPPSREQSEIPSDNEENNTSSERESITIETSNHPPPKVTPWGFFAFLHFS